jgi:hypothetical protein
MELGLKWRWTAAGMQEAAKASDFRLKAHKQLPALRAALGRERK